MARESAIGAFFSSYQNSTFPDENRVRFSLGCQGHITLVIAEQDGFDGYISRQMNKLDNCRKDLKNLTNWP
jgi:hypothetical protein